jgi:catalase-peroxidase
VTRLVGPDVAPPQDWQYPLPPPPEKLADMAAVEKDLTQMIETNQGMAKEFVRLARNTANTFRHTDYLGGCDGARIRFSPGKDWEINKGLDKVLAQLEPVKQKHGDGLTWADLIVLAGNAAVKSMGAPSDLPFSPGRSDAEDGSGRENIDWWNSQLPETIDDIVDRNEVRGLSNKEFVALCFPEFPTVAALKDAVKGEVKSETKDLEVLALKHHPELKQYVDYYISAGDEKYKTDFACAWTKLMNLDRWDGPVLKKAASDDSKAKEMAMA